MANLFDFLGLKPQMGVAREIKGYLFPFAAVSNFAASVSLSGKRRVGFA